MPPTAGLEEAEADGHQKEDHDGANVDPEVGIHSFFDCAGEGEHTHYTEGEQQLDSQDAKHLQVKKAMHHYYISITIIPILPAFKSNMTLIICGHLWSFQPAKYKIH